MDKPDYAKWTQKELWFLVDAAQLQADSEPIRPHSEFVAKCQQGTAGRAGEIYDDLKNAVTTGALRFRESRNGQLASRLVDPADCVTWAVKRGLDVPLALRGLAREPAKPNWQVWSNVYSLELWEAIALSLDIDPRRVRFDPRDDKPDFNRDGQAFADRFEVARRQRATTFEVTSVSPFQPHRTGVTLSSFVTWAHSIGWTLPQEMAAVSDSDAPRQGRWPWGDYETEMLRHLDAAVRKWWVNYDPTDPTTAPTNEELTEWLKKEFDMSQNVAGAMATILRADNLPQGPRR